MVPLNNRFRILENHRFCCSKCGSKEFVKIVVPWGSFHFYEGSMMCSNCGTSLNHGELLCYYNPSFHRVFNVVQLELF